MRAAREQRPRGTDLYVLAAMLAAAAAGRLLDAVGVLPGVHESAAVRGAGAGWATALLAAVVVAFGAARRWSRTSSLGGTAAAAGLGQLVVFFAAEAVVRAANGSAPLDPDGTVGALLQAGLAVTFLLALSVVAVVALGLSPLVLAEPLRAASRLAPQPADRAGRWDRSWVAARGPPRTAGC